METPVLLPKPSRILATLSVAFVIASCAPAIQFRQPHPSVDVCVQRNENLSDSENASFDSVVREAAGMVRHCRVVQHCDSGDTTPRLAFRPFRYDYASTAERIFKPAITVASVAGAAYTATTPLIARELAELGGVRSSAPDAQYTVVYRQVLGWDMGEIVKRMTLCMVPSAHGVDSTICAEFSEETLFNTHPTRKSTVRKLVSLLQGDTNSKKLNPAKYRRYRLAVESRATPSTTEPLRVEPRRMPTSEVATTVSRLRRGAPCARLSGLRSSPSSSGSSACRTSTISTSRWDRSTTSTARIAEAGSRSGKTASTSSTN